jgi:hypothetical protein
MSSVSVSPTPTRIEKPQPVNLTPPVPTFTAPRRAF